MIFNIAIFRFLKYPGFESILLYFASALSNAFSYVFFHARVSSLLVSALYRITCVSITATDSSIAIAT